jgi:hypothetical protein
MKAEMSINPETVKAKMEATRHEFQTQSEEVEVVAERRRGTGTGAGAPKPPKCDGTTSWTVFRRQFETVQEHNRWTQKKKSTYLITAFDGRATDVLHEVPKGANYEEILEALEDRFVDQHLAAACRNQLKSKNQGVGESLQEFVTTVEQLAHRAFPSLPEDHIRREAGKALADRVEDIAIKIKLLLGGEKMVNEALRQAFELQAVLIEAGPEKTSFRTI